MEAVHDESFIARRSGTPTAPEVVTSRYNQSTNLTRSIGDRFGPRCVVAVPDITAISIPSDQYARFVLCSDGVHDETPEQEIARVVSQQKPAEELARDLVARAVELDGGDNTTATVIRVRDVERVGMYRGRPYKLPVG